MKKISFFHATWCPPCRYMMKNVIDPLMKKYPNQIEIIDAQNEPYKADKMNVSKLPALIFFNGTEEIWRCVGLKSIERLEEFLRD